MTAPKVVKTFAGFRIEADGEWQKHPCYRIVVGSYIIGYVLWWREYVFRVAADAAGCSWECEDLENIVGFLKELNKESKP